MPESIRVDTATGVLRRGACLAAIPKRFPLDIPLRIVTILVDEIMPCGRSGADFGEKLLESEVTADTPAAVEVIIGSVGIVATAAHGMPRIVFRSRVAVRSSFDRVLLVHAAFPGSSLG
jgi:hypothetical protein